jgi:hypothetical protein
MKLLARITQRCPDLTAAAAVLTPFAFSAMTNHLLQFAGLFQTVPPLFRRACGLLLVCALASTPTVVAAPEAEPAVAFESSVPPLQDILSTLRPGHPRVMMVPAGFEAIKASVAGGGLPERIFGEVRKSADKTLTAPVSVYEKPDGRRLLSVSRRVQDRVRDLALVHRITGEDRYAKRAWAELEAASRFPDWNPAHFLDTAEMTHAFALGYDWLYDCWTVDQRRVLREAMVEKGLREGLKVYDSRKGWPSNSNNWNQVCNGGLISGALAIADEQPQLAARIVREAVCSVPLAMRHYEPDGGGTEGVGYWDYGSRFNIYLLSSLKTALGTDFGLGRVGALGSSGFYQMYLCGAGRAAFDFADCGASEMGAPQHLWLARAYDEPAFGWFRLSALESGRKAGEALDLLWFDDRGRGFDVGKLPLDRHFRGAECASMRTSWDPHALIVGIQAGDSMNLGGHRHLDLGSFILDALGERWIIDSGKEGETYQSHKHKNPRHAYYRVRAEGHNLPVLNPGQGPDQNPKAVAKIVKFESTPRQAVAVVDLGQAYQSHADRALRTFALEDRKRLVLTDELEAREPAELWWFLHTKADVELMDGGRTARLSSNGKTFHVKLREPADAAFSVMKCQPLPSSPNPAPQASNKGRSKIAIHLKGIQTTRIRVVLEP